MGRRRMRLLRTSLIVRGLDAGGATRPLGNALAILGLGCAAIAGFSGCYSTRIRLGNSSIARMRVDSNGAILPVSYGDSVCTLGCASVASRGSGYSVRTLLRDSSIARVRVDGNGGLAIAANSFATPVLDAVPRK